MDKEDIKWVLLEGDKERLSSRMQDEYSKQDTLTWALQATDLMYKRITTSLLKAKGVDASVQCIENAMSQVYSVRSLYAEDPDMQVFLSTLIHVRLDHTLGAGKLTHDSLVPNLPLYTRDCVFNLHDLIPTDKPCLIFAGSWT